MILTWEAVKSPVARLVRYPADDRLNVHSGAA